MATYQSITSRVELVRAPEDVWGTIRYGETEILPDRVNINYELRASGWSCYLVTCRGPRVARGGRARSDTGVALLSRETGSLADPPVWLREEIDRHAPPQDPRGTEVSG